MIIRQLRPMKRTSRPAVREPVNSGFPHFTFREPPQGPHFPAEPRRRNERSTTSPDVGEGYTLPRLEGKRSRRSGNW